MFEALTNHSQPTWKHVDLSTPTFACPITQRFDKLYALLESLLTEKPDTRELDGLLSTQEAADLLCVSSRTVTRWFRRKKIVPAFVSSSSRTYFTLEEIAECYERVWKRKLVPGKK